MDNLADGDVGAATPPSGSAAARPEAAGAAAQAVDTCSDTADEGHGRVSLQEVFAGPPASLGKHRDLCLQVGRDAQHLQFSADWCLSRSVYLEFIEERRGQWTYNVDFVVPCQARGLDALRSAVSGTVLPLTTFGKDLLPIAHTSTRDGSGHHVPLETTVVCRQFAYLVLLAAADDAHLCLDCLIPLLWQVTSSDPLDSECAYRKSRKDAALNLQPCAHLPAGPQAVLEKAGELLMALRLYHRSVPVLMELSEHQGEVGTRNSVTMFCDGPIRVTRTFTEIIGWNPLVVAPRAAFGGESSSYHVQLVPPQSVSVVDSRLLYSYYAPELRCGHEDNDERLRESGELTPEDAPDFIKNTVTEDWNEYWGHVWGGAEPLSAHIRCGEQRMPQLREGRILQDLPAVRGGRERDSLGCRDELALRRGLVHCHSLGPLSRKCNGSSPGGHLHRRRSRRWLGCWLLALSKRARSHVGGATTLATPCGPAHPAHDRHADHARVGFQE